MNNVIKGLLVAGAALMYADWHKNQGSLAISQATGTYPPREVQKQIQAQMKNTLLSSGLFWETDANEFVSSLVNAGIIYPESVTEIIALVNTDKMKAYAKTKKLSGWTSTFRAALNRIMTDYKKIYASLQAGIQQQQAERKAQKKAQKQAAKMQKQSQSKLRAQYQQLFGKGVGMPASSQGIKGGESGFGMNLGTVSKTVGQPSGQQLSSISSGFGMDLTGTKKPIGQASGQQSLGGDTGFGMQASLKKDIGMPTSSQKGKGASAGFGMSLKGLSKGVGETSSQQSPKISDGFGFAVKKPTFEQFAANPDKYRG